MLVSLKRIDKGNIMLNTQHIVSVETEFYGEEQTACNKIVMTNGMIYLVESHLRFNDEETGDTWIWQEDI